MMFFFVCAKYIRKSIFRYIRGLEFTIVNPCHFSNSNTVPWIHINLVFNCRDYTVPWIHINLVFNYRDYTVPWIHINLVFNCRDYTVPWIQINLVFNCRDYTVPWIHINLVFNWRDYTKMYTDVYLVCSTLRLENKQRTTVLNTGCSFFLKNVCIPLFKPCKYLLTNQPQTIL